MIGNGVRVSVNKNKLILEIGIFGWYFVGMIMMHYDIFFQTFTRHLAVSFKLVVIKTNADIRHGPWSASVSWWVSLSINRGVKYVLPSFESL